MCTYDNNGNIHFSDLTNFELLRNIQRGIVDISFEDNSETRYGLRDKTYEDIHELYMRLNLYEIKYGTAVMDAWKNSVSEKGSV